MTFQTKNYVNYMDYVFQTYAAGNYRFRNGAEQIYITPNTN